MSGIDYVIEVPDTSAFHGMVTVHTFGKEEFAQALAAYLKVKKKISTARLTKIYSGGWVMTPIIGYVATRPARKARGRTRHERGQFVIGWNRAEPYDKGKRYWHPEKHELEAMHPGRTVVETAVRPFESLEQRFIRRQRERDAIRERERAQRAAAEVAALTDPDWNGQGMNEDGDIT